MWWKRFRFTSLNSVVDFITHMYNSFTCHLVCCDVIRHRQDCCVFEGKARPLHEVQRWTTKSTGCEMRGEQFSVTHGGFHTLIGLGQKTVSGQRHESTSYHILQALTQNPVSLQLLAGLIGWHISISLLSNHAAHLSVWIFVVSIFISKLF